MSPILQSRANASAYGYRSFVTAAATSSFESIATVSVGAGGASDVTFSSIPSTYTHLQIRGISNPATSGANLSAQINSDTGTNYTYHEIGGNGSSAFAQAETGKTAMLELDGANNSTSYGAIVMDILDYTNTNKYKTVRTLSGFDSNGGGTVRLVSHLWLNTNAITTIKLFYSGQNLRQYSHFALYGIKSA